MRIAYIHNVEIELDSRTQKEIYALISNGHEVLFCGWDKSKTCQNEPRTMDLRGIRFGFLNICEKVRKGEGLKSNLFPLIRYEWKLLRWIWKNHKRYDAIHGCSFDVTILALPLARLFHKKVIYDIYDDYAQSHIVGRRLYGLIRRVDGYLIEHVDTLIICSEKRMEQVASKKAKKIVIIHNTPDIKNMDTDRKVLKASSKFRIAYIGNLGKGRHTYELARIVTENPEWELHCGGSGELEGDIRDLAEKYENIFFYGRLSYEETLSIEADCDVIPALYDPAFPNHRYAAPNKFYEAVCLGKPTIMAHDTGMDEMVDRYGLGITVDFDQEAIRGALDKIYGQRDEWKGKKDTIKNIYDRHYSWELMERRLLEIYG